MRRVWLSPLLCLRPLEARAQYKQYRTSSTNPSASSDNKTRPSRPANTQIAANKRSSYVATLTMALLLSALATGCEAPTQSDAPTVATDVTTTADSTQANSSLSTTATPPLDPANKASNRQQPLTINWAQIDTKVTPVPSATFAYPFGVDDPAVKAYVDFFKVTPQQAQHNLTVSTASNEALAKVLEQLGDSYVSHTVTDDERSTLVIDTTPNVAASEFDYVLAGDFGRGLVLPIVVRPRPITDTADAKTDMTNAKTNLGAIEE